MVYEVHAEGMDGDLYFMEDFTDLVEAEEAAESYARINGRMAVVVEEDTDDLFADYIYSTED